MSSQNTSERGLRRLDDETLAQIVESEVNENGQLSEAGRIAMEELSRRTPVNQ